MTPHRFALAAIALAAGAAGCAVTPTPTIDAFAQSSGANSFEWLDRRVQPAETLVLPVAHDRQRSGPSCGAHALASVISYWQGVGVTGNGLFTAHPPAQPHGYSMSELTAMAQGAGLLASAVRLPQDGLIRELEQGRPVLTPVRAPSIFLQQRVLPGGDVPVVGFARNALIARTARVSEWTGLAMVDHYLVVVGHDGDTFVVVEPVMGYRTISFARLARFRAPFGDAALVVSAAPS